MFFCGLRLPRSLHSLAMTRTNSCVQCLLFACFFEFFSELGLFFAEFFGDVDSWDHVHRSFGFEYSSFTKSFVSYFDQIGELCSFGHFDFHRSFWMWGSDFSSENEIKYCHVYLGIKVITFAFI